MQELKQYPVIFEQRVAWGDMDAFSHVNNVQYYRYIENARIAYLSLIDLKDMEIMTVIVKSSCHYLSPVQYPDTLNIATRVEEIRHSAIRMCYQLFSEQQQKIIASGEAVIVCLDKANYQKVKLPQSLIDNILQLETSVGHIPVQI